MADDWIEGDHDRYYDWQDELEEADSAHATRVHDWQRQVQRNDNALATWIRAKNARKTKPESPPVDEDLPDDLLF